MGYILPITHYSYINYEHRMRKNKESPYYVEKPFKVVLGERRHGITERDTNNKEPNHFKKAVNVKSHVKVGMTGKGHQVNVKV